MINDDHHVFGASKMITSHELHLITNYGIRDLSIFKSSSLCMF